MFPTLLAHEMPQGTSTPLAWKRGQAPCNRSSGPSPGIHTGSLFSRGLSVRHHKNKPPLLRKCKDFIELLLAQKQQKATPSQSRLCGTWICLGTDGDGRAKGILKISTRNEAGFHILQVSPRETEIHVSL